MRVLRALIVLVIGVTTSVHVIAARPGQTPLSASLSGAASDSTGRVLANTRVQLRNVSTGQLVASTSNGAGQFSFVGLTPGTYVVEVVDAAGRIVGTSGSVVVSGGAATTGVSVTAAATTKVAAAGGLSSHATALILGAAAAAGVAGGIAIATNGTASPSQ